MLKATFRKSYKPTKTSVKVCPLHWHETNEIDYWRAGTKRDGKSLKSLHYHLQSDDQQLKWFQRSV